MNDISKLAGIDAEEVKKLRSKKIETIDDLWNCIGANPDRGIVRVARLTGIPRDRLIILLTARGVREARSGGGPWLQRHWLDITLIVVVLFLAVLLLRALGLLASLPPPLGLRSNVMVATRDLEAGRVVRLEDVYTVTLEPETNTFTTARDLEGLVLTHTVASRRPIRFEDVLRPQVIALVDIPAETVIASTAITMTWSPYQPDAALRLDQVAGHTTHHAIQKGKVVIATFVDSKRALMNNTNASWGISPPAAYIRRPVLNLGE